MSVLATNRSFHGSLLSRGPSGPRATERYIWLAGHGLPYAFLLEGSTPSGFCRSSFHKLRRSVFSASFVELLSVGVVVVEVRLRGREVTVSCLSRYLLNSGLKCVTLMLCLSNE